MTMNKYVGSRYVPLYIGVHDKAKAYEPLSIVSNEAKTKTYTSKQSVPVGIELDNEDYWAQSGYFQDGIVELNPDIEELASYENPIFTVTKDETSAEIKLETPDAYVAGNSFNNAYVLNEVTAPGVYIIKPSACAEVPSDLESSDDPASLSVVIYRYKSGEKDYYMQQITSGNGIYTRTGDGAAWEEWKINSGSNFTDSRTIYFYEDSTGKTSVNVRRLKPSSIQENEKKAIITEVYTAMYDDSGLAISYGEGLTHTSTYKELMLATATASSLGGIKVGDGLSIDSDGVLSVTGSGSQTSYSPGDGINISSGVISAAAGDGIGVGSSGIYVNKTWSNGSFTVTWQQPAFETVTPKGYDYNQSTNTVIAYFEESDFVYASGGTTTGSNITSVTLPKARNSSGSSFVVVGGICNKNTGLPIEGCYALFTFNSLGVLSHMSYINPTNTTISSTTATIRLEYQKA